MNTENDSDFDAEPFIVEAGSWNKCEVCGTALPVGGTLYEMCGRVDGGGPAFACVTVCAACRPRIVDSDCDDDSEAVCNEEEE